MYEHTFGALWFRLELDHQASKQKALKTAGDGDDHDDHDEHDEWEDSQGLHAPS